MEVVFTLSITILIISILLITKHEHWKREQRDIENDKRQKETLEKFQKKWAEQLEIYKPGTLIYIKRDDYSQWEEAEIVKYSQICFFQFFEVKLKNGDIQEIGDFNIKLR